MAMYQCWFLSFGKYVMEIKYISRGVHWLRGSLCYPCYLILFQDRKLIFTSWLNLKRWTQTPLIFCSWFDRSKCHLLWKSFHMTLHTNPLTELMVCFLGLWESLLPNFSYKFGLLGLDCWGLKPGCTSYQLCDFQHITWCFLGLTIIS